MTQLEALQKKFINLRFGTFIHFNLSLIHI